MTEKEEIIILDSYDADKLPQEFTSHYFTHILCHNGTGQLRMNGATYPIKPDDIVILLPLEEVEDLLFSIDFQADFLFMSYDIATKNNPDISWGIKGYLFSKENPVVSLSKPDKQKCLWNFQVLKSVCDDTKHRFRKEMLNRYVQVFIMDMWNIFAQKIEERLSFTGQRISLFERFLNLADTHCMEHRDLGFYSDKLCITTKYLTELCKKNSGKTAGEWIQNYTTQRIIILLRNPNLSFTEIADALHFSSQSFFSRYVRSVLGVSPNEFRQGLGQ